MSMGKDEPEIPGSLAFQPVPIVPDRAKIMTLWYAYLRTISDTRVDLSYNEITLNTDLFVIVE